MKTAYPQQNVECLQHASNLILTCFEFDLSKFKA